MAAELGDFLRARRERVSPADVGLPPGRRRRTPGLRREEVAALAGISIEYLIRLEQGRDGNPSASVLAALAEVLRLNPAEKQHMGMLAARGNYEEICPSRLSPAEQVPHTIELLLRRLEPTPAFVMGPFGDVLGWNATWTRLVAPLGLLDGPRPNLNRFTFLHPAATTAYPEWGAVADERALDLRAATRAWAEDEGFQALLGELMTAPEFERRWLAHQFDMPRRHVLPITHPTAGQLTIEVEVLLLGDGTDQRLVTWLAGDPATELAIDSLLADAAPKASGPRLRVVGER